MEPTLIYSETLFALNIFSIMWKLNVASGFNMENGLICNLFLSIF